jgi:hypothetical protein
MDDLKSVTLAYLRDLARKHLGPGHSKLNKTELIAALAEHVPALKKLARLAGIELPTRSKPAAKAVSSAAKPSRESRGKEARVAKKKEPERKKAPEKKEPEKKAAERKPEPEKKAAEPKPEPQKKAAERKPEPEKKAAEPKPEPQKKAAEPKPEPQKKAADPTPEPQKQAAASQSRKSAKPSPAAAKADDASQSLKHAQVVNFPPRQRSARSAEEEWAGDSDVVDEPALEGFFQQPAEPLMEGFFVARLMGERELRRHHLTEEQASRPGSTSSEGFEENLGELPLDYGNDLALALARDPHTLFITWDFSSVALERAREGLESPRAMLRVFDGDRLVRELEFVPESRSFYIHGLPPGRPYRVEAHFMGREGRSRRIGHSTHPLVLPRTGLSTDTAVRFMQMPPPPQVPVTGLAPAPVPQVAAPTASREETVEEREYITWRRVALPGSDEMATVAESRRDRITRLARESAGLPEHLEVTTGPLGSSEQSQPKHLEISARPFGSSEQSAAAVAGRAGASEQTHWTPPQSGRGR